MLKHDLHGGPGDELQRTLGLYGAIITSSLLSPPVVTLLAVSNGCYLEAK